MPNTAPPTFALAEPRRDRARLLALNVEYMDWNSVELERLFGVSVAAVVGMPVADYVESMLDKVCFADAPPRGAFYLVEHGGEAVAMGGLRTIAPGIGELKRLYVRPTARGLGIGPALVARLLADAGAFGLTTLRLDTAPFMHAAHRLYAAAGFVDRGPYAEAEVPVALHERWRFMERRSAATQRDTP